MIEFNDFDLFKESKSTLKDTYKNNSYKKNIIYMIEREDEVINFILLNKNILKVKD